MHNPGSCVNPSLLQCKIYDYNYFVSLLWAKSVSAKHAGLFAAQKVDVTINTDCKLLHALSSVYISNILCDNFIVTFYLISIYVNKGYMIFQEAFGEIGCVIVHKTKNNYNNPKLEIWGMTHSNVSCRNILITPWQMWFKRGAATALVGHKILYGEGHVL